VIVFFDGVCNLCNGAVQFLNQRDPKGVFQYAALQSQAARTHLPAPPAGEAWPDSIIVVDDGKAFVKSDAVLRIARRMRWPWRALVAGRLLPRPVRDALYDAVATRRYRWFGRRDVCMIPTPDLQRRFLD
jgi:predicted DCC family thiol-disulfide oxidoreductase YuxK